MQVQRNWMPWVQVPASELLETLQQMKWQKTMGKSTARDVAALMVYVVLLFLRTERVANRPMTNAEWLLGGQGGEEDGEVLVTEREYVADATYDDLEHLTGLSRSLISQGLARLIELGRINTAGTNQKRIYVLRWPDLSGRWFKLPCRALVGGGQTGIAAFKTFTLRSKHELNALKLYLYLASVRDNLKQFSEVSYELIHQRIGISERDIRRAINVLTASGLLARVHRDTDRLSNMWGPNQYYLAGYRDLAREAA